MVHDLHRATLARGSQKSRRRSTSMISVAVSVSVRHRNFEGVISPDVRAKLSASPPLVVAYAIAGDMNIDITKRPDRHVQDGKPRVYLRYIWPTHRKSRDLGRKGDRGTREAFLKNTPMCSKGGREMASGQNHR